MTRFCGTAGFKVVIEIDPLLLKFQAERIDQLGTRKQSLRSQIIMCLIYTLITTYWRLITRKSVFSEGTCVNVKDSSSILSVNARTNRENQISFPDEFHS